MSIHKNENDKMMKNNIEESVNPKDSSKENAINLSEKNIEDVVILPRGKRCIVFILFMLMNLTINMDNGTVPALIDQISGQLELPKEIIGLFGSLQYGGNLIGNKK